MGTNRLYLSNGQGGFSQRLDPIGVGAINGGDQWTVGDFNGDGRTDVYFWWRTVGTNRLYLSNGQGGFSQHLDPIPVSLIENGDQWLVSGATSARKAQVVFWWRASGTNRLVIVER